jgi:hypothetical protein
MEIKTDAIDSDIRITGAYKTSQQSKTFYVKAGKSYLHRVIMERILGRALLRSEKVDHIDGNGLNNARSNLRVLSHSENLANREKTSKTTNRFKGITKCKRTGKWQAKIMFNYKTIHLGTFVNDADAAKAYDNAALEYFGNAAKVNLGVYP